MNQLIQNLYKEAKSPASGHNTSSDSLESLEPMVPADREGGSPAVVYRKIMDGGDIPTQGLRRPAPDRPVNFRHQTTDDFRKSLPIEDKEKTSDENTKKIRKKRLEELSEREREKRILQDAERNASRRHHDFFTPAQKSPISPRRFDDAMASSLRTLPKQAEVVSPLRTLPKQPTNQLIETDKMLKALDASPRCGQRQGRRMYGKAKALFNFTAQNPQELSFNKGAVLYLLRQVDKNWFQGEHYGHVGIVPANYVQVLPSDEDYYNGDEAIYQAKAKFDFDGKSPAELSLSKGDYVTVLRTVNEHWLEGIVRGQQGIFPSSYVDIVCEPATPPGTPVTSVITSGTSERLSPVSIETPSPPPQPSPSALAQLSPANSVSGFRQINRRLLSLDPTDELSSLEAMGTISSDCGFRQNNRRLFSPKPTDELSTLQAMDSINSDIGTRQTNMRLFSPNSTDKVSTLETIGSTNLNCDFRQTSQKLFASDQIDELLGRIGSSTSDNTNNETNRISCRSNKTEELGSLGISASNNLDTGFIQSKKTPYGSFSTEELVCLEPIDSSQKVIHPQADYSASDVLMDISQPSDLAIDNSFPDIEMIIEDPNIEAGSTVRLSNKRGEILLSRRYKAICDYSPANAEELELKEGDDVVVMEKCDHLWLAGVSVRTGHYGSFPTICVQRTDIIKAPLKTMGI